MSSRRRVSPGGAAIAASLTGSAGRPAFGADNGESNRRATHLSTVETKQNRADEALIPIVPGALIGDTNRIRTGIDAITGSVGRACVSGSASIALGRVGGTWQLAATQQLDTLQVTARGRTRTVPVSDPFGATRTVSPDW